MKKLWVLDLRETDLDIHEIFDDGFLGECVGNDAYYRFYPRMDNPISFTAQKLLAHLLKYDEFKEEYEASDDYYYKVLIFIGW